MRYPIKSCFISRLRSELMLFPRAAHQLSWNSKNHELRMNRLWFGRYPRHIQFTIFFKTHLMRAFIYWIWWILPCSNSLWILWVSRFSPSSCSPDVSLNFSSKDNKIILKKSMGRLKASCEYKFCVQRVEKSWNSLLKLKLYIEFSIMSATEKANKNSKKTCKRSLKYQWNPITLKALLLKWCRNCCVLTGSAFMPSCS